MLYLLNLHNSLPASLSKGPKKLDSFHPPPPYTKGLKVSYERVRPQESKYGGCRWPSPALPWKRRLNLVMSVLLIWTIFAPFNDKVVMFNCLSTKEYYFFNLFCQ